MSYKFVFTSVLCLPLACFRASDDEGMADEIGDSIDSEGTDTSTSTDTTSTSTETTDETTDTGPPPDSDQDGIDDLADNCPNDPNPNQLDFDGDGQGNVCDVLIYNTISGSLATVVNADAGIGSCNVPIDLAAAGGKVLVQLDDDAQLVRVELSELKIADILDQPCQIVVINASVSIKDFAFSNGGGPFPVSTAHSQAEHDAGTAAGLTNLPHPLFASGSLEASVNGDPPSASPLELMDAKLPPMGVQISGAGDSMTLTWPDNNFVIGTSSFMINTPIMLNVDVTFVGASGELTLSP